MTETIYEPEVGTEIDVRSIPVDDKNRLLVATDDIGKNDMWNHAGSTEVAFDDLQHIPTPSDTSTYSAVGHADFVETLYKHADRLMAPRDFQLSGQRYLVSKEGERMFFIHHYENNDSGISLATAGRNSHDKSMKAALAVAARVTVCDNTALMADDGVVIFRRHTGNVRDYLNDQIILSMVKATEGWDDMRSERDALTTQPVELEEGYRLMGLAKAQTRSDSSASRRLLTTDAEWKKVQEYWEEPGHEYEGGNRTLWAWMNSFTFNFRSLHPERQLPQHSSLHAITRQINAPFKVQDDDPGNADEQFGTTLERLTNDSPQ
tara:strand:- start:35 stop:994 length:960 start_codon:yes stop_codon:yes gene_type:complete